MASIGTILEQTGKKYVPSDGNDNGDYGTRKIDGIYYCFDDDGILQMGWKNVRGSSDSIQRLYVLWL